MSVDLAIVFTPVGGGHKAAALAVAEAAQARGLSVALVDLFEVAPRLVGDAYKTAHLTGQSAAPWLYGNVYFASNRREGALEPLRRSIDHVAFAPLRRRIRELSPRAVVATHHLPLVVLGRARRRERLPAPLVGVVTDYTSHACWAEAGVDAFAVACPLARHELVLHGIVPDRIAMTGIPVKRAFRRVPAVEDPRPGEPLRVLVTSGGFGVGPVRDIVRSFRGVHRAELTIVCGVARGLCTRVARAAAASGVRARVLGFEKDMAARMAEAHLVVGKAGGLTVSETLTAGRGMILVGTVPGNEISNERLVVDGGGGIAARPSEVGRVADSIRWRGEIAAMGARARSLVLGFAADGVVDLALGLADRSVSRAA